MEQKHANLVYFSPTKTTKKILESIVKEMNFEKINHFDLTYPKNDQKPITFSNELVIIGAPVYAGRLPVIAVERLKQLKANNTLAILIVVYGNRDFDDALLELKNLSIELGFTPLAAGAFIGEHSFSSKTTPIGHGRPDEKDIQNTKEFVQKIKTLSTPPTNLKVPGNFPYKEAMPPNSIAPMLNEELCGLCGECVDVCPTEAITLQEKIITDAFSCIRCAACIKSCPNEARFIGNDAWKAIANKLNQNCSTRKEPQFFL